MRCLREARSRSRAAVLTWGVAATCKLCPRSSAGAGVSARLGVRWAPLSGAPSQPPAAAVAASREPSLGPAAVARALLQGAPPAPPARRWETRAPDGSRGDGGGRRSGAGEAGGSGGSGAAIREPEPGRVALRVPRAAEAPLGTRPGTPARLASGLPPAAGLRLAGSSALGSPAPGTPRRRQPRAPARRSAARCSHGATALSR
ncbi:hypothetical protein GHT09_016512 [Marmota monax]|uniref:Uncharacterized protein n=1 Tax=Marmota monax TaxID=9995 RepID=A0A834Q817_MARMO|nr:hypothetical protein GHT09_016512 [Marmota monax]